MQQRGQCKDIWSLIGGDRWRGSTDKSQVWVIDKGVQVSGKRDAGKRSAEAA